jgi:DNA-damage-inducible protein J
MKTKSIQVRLDGDMKKRVEAVLAKIGVDVPTAVRMFFMRVVATGGIPFSLQAEQENHYTPTQIRKIERMVAKAEKEKPIGPFYNIEDLLKSLHE